MSVKERIKKFIKHKGISVRRFEEKCGLSYSYISNMRNSIQPDKVLNIANQYPDLNTGWLLTGEGEMLKQVEKPIPTSNSTSSDPMAILQFLMEEKKAATLQIDGLIRQNEILSETIRSQNEIIKKTVVTKMSDVQLEEGAECAAASGSDLED